MSVTALLQSFGATRAGGSAARLGYRAMARVAAWRIGRHPAVDGVYLNGSATRSGRIRPGFSDLDLVAMAELPTLEHELALRRHLAAELRALSVFRPLFKHVDYFERRDLEYMRRLGNSWCLDLDRLWRFLDGNDRLGSSAGPTAQKRRLEALISALRRWQGSSSFLADPANDRAIALNAIGARRTLGDVLAAFLGVDRFQSLDRLLAELAVRGRDRLIDPARLASDEPGTVEACLVASLELLDALAAEVAATWNVAWSARLDIDLPLAPSAPERDSLWAAARSAGFTAVAYAPHRYGHGVPFVLTGPELSPRRALLALRGLLERRAAWPRPVLLTPALWRAAAALDPAPFAGASLAQHAENILGESGAPPGAPPAATWDDLIAGRAVQMLNRPRGRGLRSGALESTAAAKLAYEVRSVAPVLTHLLRGEPARLGPFTGAPGDEAALVAELRAWGDGVRPELERRL